MNQVSKIQRTCIQWIETWSYLKGNFSFQAFPDVVFIPSAMDEDEVNQENFRQVSAPSLWHIIIIILHLVTSEECYYNER